MVAGSDIFFVVVVVLFVNKAARVKNGSEASLGAVV